MDHRARDNSSPADALAAPEKHPKLGRPTAKWTYRDGGAAAKSVAIVSPPADASVGRDAAEADGWTHERCAGLVRSAKQADAAASPGGGTRRRAPQRDTLISMTELCNLRQTATERRSRFHPHSASARRMEWQRDRGRRTTTIVPRQPTI
jgi:hypothetical protein